jgi:hypothetical protein
VIGPMRSFFGGWQDAFWAKIAQVLVFGLCFVFENKIFTIRPQVYQKLTRFVRCPRVSALHRTLLALLVNWMGPYPQPPTR